MSSCEKTCSRKIDEKICSEAPDSGVCYAAFDKYFYDGESGTCYPFTYGGCGGNKNRFHTPQSCMKSCSPKAIGDLPTICYHPKDEGRGNGSYERYFFNIQSGRCEEYKFRGLGAKADWSLNNFESMEICESVCGAFIGWDKNLCFQPPDGGPCRASFRRFFHNSTSNKCEEFIYGGCFGNLNRFKEKSDCERMCSEANISYDDVDDDEVGDVYVPPFSKYNVEEEICSSSSKLVPCTREKERYHYAANKGECVEVAKGLCATNRNNYISKEDCETYCGKNKTIEGNGANRICKQPQAQGDCLNFTPRYFYNPTSNACEEFIYSGCDGNQNSFEDPLTCEHLCYMNHVDKFNQFYRDNQYRIDSMEEEPGYPDHDGDEEHDGTYHHGEVDTIGHVDEHNDDKHNNDTIDNHGHYSHEGNDVDPQKNDTVAYATNLDDENYPDDYYDAEEDYENLYNDHDDDDGY